MSKVRAAAMNGEAGEVIASFSAPIPPVVMALPLTVLVSVVNAWVRLKQWIKS